ncbi:MAG: GTP 3',8-cyclase MoaA [Proteobacteria bacterium]|nr:GTP 3',8-cyclase MoaA [Pseudomonadota bacterium]
MNLPRAGNCVREKRIRFSGAGKDSGVAIIDRYARNINYLRVSVTDRCNLRCAYCMPKEGLSRIGHDDILRYEEILRIIRVAAGMGITKVRITGGEPLVRRGVVEFIASLRAVPEITDISLTTTGILLEDCAEALFAAGIKRINVSLDSLNAEKYARITRGGELRNVLRGIQKAREVGFSPIKINTVAIKGVNDDEIAEFARLTLSNPYQVRFIELMPLGTAGGENNGRYLANDFIRERIGQIGRLDPVNGNSRKNDGPAQIYRLAGGAGEIGFISPVSRHFCDSCNRLRLTADGFLRSCLLVDDEMDLKGPLRAGCGDSGIEDLIRQAILRKPRQHEVICEEGLVKKCMKEMPAIGG